MRLGVRPKAYRINELPLLQLALLPAHKNQTIRIKSYQQLFSKEFLNYDKASVFSHLDKAVCIGLVLTSIIEVAEVFFMVVGNITAPTWLRAKKHST
jgi:hypothetical protein